MGLSVQDQSHMLRYKWCLRCKRDCERHVHKSDVFCGTKDEKDTRAVLVVSVDAMRPHWSGDWLLTPYPVMSKLQRITNLTFDDKYDVEQWGADVAVGERLQHVTWKVRGTTWMARGEKWDRGDMEFWAVPMCKLDRYADQKWGKGVSYRKCRVTKTTRRCDCGRADCSRPGDGASPEREPIEGPSPSEPQAISNLVAGLPGLRVLVDRGVEG